MQFDTPDVQEQMPPPRRQWPSPRTPWLIILVLLTAIVLVYLAFLRPPGQLLGPPLPPDNYRRELLPDQPVRKTPPPAISLPNVTSSAINRDAVPPPPAPAATSESSRVVRE